MSLSNNVKQATALKYQMDKENSAPVVVASGMGVAAQKIVDVAIENNVPIFEDDSLAALLSQLSVGREVPTELFQAIVDIYVYFLNFTIDTKSSTALGVSQTNPTANTQTSSLQAAVPEKHTSDQLVHEQVIGKQFVPERHTFEQFEPYDRNTQSNQLDTADENDEDFVPF